MRIFLTSTLFLSTLLTNTLALPDTSPTPTSPPTLAKRQSDSDASRLSSALASATSAIADNPDSAASIISSLESDYGSILSQATGCESSRWARITGAIGDVDEDFGDGVRGVLDGIFDRDGDCDDGDDEDDDDDDDDGLLDEIFDDAAGSTKAAYFGVVAVALLAGVALL